MLGILTVSVRGILFLVHQFGEQICRCNKSLEEVG